jgi:hypothetical protein
MLQEGKVKQNTVRNSKLSYRGTVSMVNSQWLTLKISFSLTFTFFLLMIKLTTHLLVRSRHWAVQHKWQLRPCCLTSRPSLLAFNSLALAILQRRTRMYGVMVRLKPTIYLRFFLCGCKVCVSPKIGEFLMLKISRISLIFLSIFNQFWMFGFFLLDLFSFCRYWSFIEIFEVAENAWV